MKIFFSYGHDEYENLAQRIKRDLEEEGFEIWIDKENIKGTADWENAIEKGISSSDWLVLLMTEHSVRRPDGVCLDEVSYARFLGKSIAPIMIQEVKPPLCIARIQWIDMKNFVIPGRVYFDEESYQARKDELLSILRGIQQLNLEGEQKSLRSKLNPLDNDVYTAHFRQNFYGRQSLIEYYEKWYNSNKKILWFVGDAGIGKTAFIANLSKIRDEIQAVHFCRYNDNERANPKRALMSIAYYMATQINDYKQKLFELQDLDSLIEKSTNRLFEYLIVEPLSKISYKGKPLVIVIDALDEATLNGRNELADIIAKQFDKTPDWLKIVITSRREALLERKLSKFNPINFSDSTINDNLGDIKGYLSVQLKNHLPKNKQGDNILNELTAKSEGIFLYAKTIVDEIIEGNISIYDVNNFPEGLTGIYIDYFDRIFQSDSHIDYKRDVRPLMEILCATSVPLSEQLICDILMIDEYDFDDISELIYEMFPIRNHVMEPIHKSLIDWLSNPQKSGSYRVSLRRGHHKIADYYIKLIESNHYHADALKYLCKHLIADKRVEEAVTFLCNDMFQNKRIEIMGLDSAVREYLYELEELHHVAVESSALVLNSPVFVNLFSTHRKFFYNSGLYFSLKKCGFDAFLSSKTACWDTNGEIGIVYYYYITESFEKAIDSANKLLKSYSLSAIMQEELRNIIGLCYRKFVDFEQAKEQFLLAYDISKEANEYYYQSTALINLGKIAYHELDWSLAAEYNENGIYYLEKELLATCDNNYKTTLLLFLAEYHRLIAECLIWSGDLSQVDSELESAEKIYQQVQSRDRYYIRYLYTTEFRNLLAGRFLDVYENCDLLLQQATSSYDKSQILFYKSIAALKLRKNDEVIEYTEKAYNYAKDIGAWLEVEEIISVNSMADSDIRDLLDHSNCFQTNTAIQKWLSHAKEFIKKL